MDEHGRFTIPVDPVFSHKVYDSSKREQSQHRDALFSWEGKRPGM